MEIQVETLLLSKIEIRTWIIMVCLKRIMAQDMSWFVNRLSKKIFVEYEDLFTF
jgi:hypothetical protein